jgi:hypothetical protein
MLMKNPSMLSWFGQENNAKEIKDFALYPNDY